jgi:hypothetical protein
VQLPHSSVKGNSIAARATASNGRGKRQTGGCARVGRQYQRNAIAASQQQPEAGSILEFQDDGKASNDSTTNLSTTKLEALIRDFVEYETAKEKMVRQAG